MSRRQNELAIVVPVFNEASDLWSMSVALAAHLDRIVGAGRWQYLIVDNGSDDTPDVVARVAKVWSATLALRLPKPDYGEALCQGLRAAQSEWVYIINVEFWDEVMLSWCWHHRGLYDLVLGSRRSHFSGMGSSHAYEQK